MVKEIYYPKFIGAKISEDQYEKIERSGMSTSEYVREAIDFYSETRLNSYNSIKINMIDECIQRLNVFKQNVKNADVEKFNNLTKNIKSVKQKGDKTLNKTYEKFNENEEKVKPEKKVKPERLNKTEENVKPPEENQKQNPFQSIENTLIRLIANKGHLTQEDYTFQASRVGKTSAELKKYVLQIVNIWSMKLGSTNKERLNKKG